MESLHGSSAWGHETCATTLRAGLRPLHSPVDVLVRTVDRQACAFGS